MFIVHCSCSLFIVPTVLLSSLMMFSFLRWPLCFHIALCCLGCKYHWNPYNKARDSIWATNSLYIVDSYICRPCCKTLLLLFDMYFFGSHGTDIKAKT